MPDLFWLSDEAWAMLELYLPKNQPGKPLAYGRLVISGILHVLKSSDRLQDVLAKYGPANTIDNRYTR